MFVIFAQNILLKKKIRIGKTGLVYFDTAIVES